MDKIITIPSIIDVANETDNLIIDMSDLRFDAPEEKKKFFSFIFIRNSGIKATLSFEKCSYKDKEEFLMMFLTSNIEICCPILASTWIEILSSTEEIFIPSILDANEIRMFQETHVEFLNHIHQLINSLPLYAIYGFHPPDDCSMDMNEFDESEFNSIKLNNFYQLAEFDHFTLLLDPTPPEEQKPVFFTTLFKDPDNAYDMMMIMEKLPYLNLLITMFSDTGKQSTAINAITSLLQE